MATLISTAAPIVSEVSATIGVQPVFIFAAIVIAAIYTLALKYA